MACVREKGDAYMVLVGKREGKSPFERRRRRWSCNVKLDLQEMGST